ncbi:MAG: hypothetical protein J5778_09160 [Clostridiales bacterium]|nr:hypothetical protein [Clostridiales bacterium]
MLRPFEFRLAATKRRGLRLFIFLTIILILTAALLLLWMGIFGFRAELVNISFRDDLRDDQFEGAGINIDHVPSVNLVRDASFETGYEYLTLTASDFDGKNIYFTSDSVTGSDISLENLAGGDLRVLGSDSDGVMSRKYTGQVESYYPESMAEVTDMTSFIPGGFISEIADVEVYGNCVTILSGDGMIYADITGASPVKTGGDDVVFSAIASSGDICYAITTDGTVYEASDGRSFVAVTAANDEIRNVTSCVASGNKLLILNGTEDLYIYNGGLFAVKLPDGAKPSCMGRIGDVFIIASDKGIFYSDNGYVFTVKSDISVGKDSVADVAMSEERLFIVSVAGDLIVCDRNGANEETVEFDSGTPVVRSAVCGQDGKLIISTSDRVAMSFDERSGRYTIISTVDSQVDKLLARSAEGFFYSSGKKLYRASVLSLIKISESVAPDSISRGDICSVMVDPAVNAATSVSSDSWEPVGQEMVWDIYGKGTSVSYAKDAISGSKSLKVSGTGENAHVISQRLPGTSAENFIPDVFYRLRFSAKSTDDVNVTCWLEGDKFGKVSFADSIPASSVKTLSTIFAVTNSMTGDDTVRLYISFTGKGTIYIDDVYLGPDTIGENYIPTYLTDTLREASPKAVRLAGLAVGSEGYSPDILYSHSQASASHFITRSDETQKISSCDSLEDCLEMLSASGSDPWIVIGSNAGEADISDFMSYMCGSVSEGYGARRVTNGTAVPWSREFDRIYIEIADTDGSFASDAARGGYVDYMISVIEQSEYYPAIKEKVVFLDGMNYDGGIRLSKADSHTLAVNASDIMEVGNSDVSYTANVATFFNRINTEAERSRIASDSGQYISSMSLAEKASCAEYTAMFLCEEAGFVEIPMMNIAIDYRPAYYNSGKMFEDGKSATNLFSTMKMLSDVAGGGEFIMHVPDLAEPMDPSSEENVADFSKMCGVYAFSTSSGENYLVVANCSQEMRQFVISSATADLFNSYATCYSAEGKVVSSGKFGRLFNRRVLNAGEVLIVKVENR